MALFNSYSGSALLNNALMSIEGLAGLSDVSEITPSVLMDLYKKLELPKLNQRLKSYTMLFTKNGPLHNDALTGLQIYDNLMKLLIENVEVEGNRTCEISGLKFNTTFDETFATSLRKLNIDDNKIKGKDKTINRCWFPLIGGLGSDAQALPQAKFAVQIHPLCIAIMQFLPLSAVVYKGGILLVDSSNFEFAKEFVQKNILRVKEQIELTKAGAQIENIKDYGKGNYLLLALDILMSKEDYEEYSDLNLWNFSNSGTGASCEIDRIPNQLIRKLRILRSDPNCRNQLELFLTNPKLSNIFLEKLYDNFDFFGLYPSKNFPGVSPSFYEKYQQLIDNTIQIDYAIYIATLIERYKTKHFEKYLIKTDAIYNNDYKADFFTVLTQATEDGVWTLNHHLNILDDKDTVPVKSNTYNIYNIVHYYYQNRNKFSQGPLPFTEVIQKSKAAQVCSLFIQLIESYPKKEAVIKDLINPQKYNEVNLLPLFTYHADKFPLTDVHSLLYVYDERENRGYRMNKFGTSELLRLYYLQNEKNPLTSPEFLPLQPENIFFNKYTEFAEDYQNYYYEKYKHSFTGELPEKKYKLHVIENFPYSNEQFLKWLSEALDNLNCYLEVTNNIKNKWSEDLLYNPSGEKNIGFARFAIEFSINKHYQTNKQINN